MLDLLLLIQYLFIDQDKYFLKMEFRNQMLAKHLQIMQGFTLISTYYFYRINRTNFLIKYQFKATIYIKG